MITNFMYPDKKKVKYTIEIPPEPQLFDNFELFRLFTCLGCFTSLIIFENYLLAVFIFAVCCFLATCIWISTIRIMRIRKRISCLKIIKKIYDTPVLTQDENIATYKFLAPSEKLVNQILYLNKILD